jgi:hypothetical protein
MVLMRLRAFILSLTLASTVLAQTPRELAVEDAVARLEAQVRQQSLADGTTLGELIDRLDAHESLLQTLRRADQVGGVRRLGADHVQIQYRIDGRLVRLALIDATQATGSPTELAVALAAALDEVQFVAIGSSLPSNSPATPRQRLEARVIESIRAAPSLSDVVLDEASLRSRLQRSPVLTEHDGAVTRHTLSPDYADLLGSFLSPAQAQALWPRLKTELPTTYALVIESPHAVQSTQIASTLPIPEWVDSFIRASGTAAAGATPLLTARASEDQARRQLRLAVGELMIDDQRLDDTFADDAARRDALDRVVQSARVLSTEYHNDGSAVTTVSVDGRRVWDIAAP